MKRIQKDQQVNQRINKNTAGFTIVELLIVVVVIAILAAIAIVAYNGITQRSKESALKSELKSNVGKIESIAVTSGDYPATQTSADLKVGSGRTLTYKYRPGGYCIAIEGDGKSFRAMKDKAIEEGRCANGGVVTSFAGNGSVGSTDGLGSVARFNNPNDIAIDSTGNLYVADSGNHAIRKITPQGLVSTLAGGTQGFADGSGSSAQFNYPTGIVVDSTGTLYVADHNNNRIRQVTSAGQVTTYAGSGAVGAGNGGYLDGARLSALFNRPYGIAIDSSGALYITDKDNFKVRKITSGGMVSTLAGGPDESITDGTGSAARFRGLAGIEVDSSGLIYVGGLDLSRLRTVTQAGVVTTQSLSSTGYAIKGFAFDGATTYLADHEMHRIYQVTDGVRTVLAGSSMGYGNNTGAAATFRYPSAVVVDASGNVYVADTNNSTIRKIE